MRLGVGGAEHAEAGPGGELCQLERAANAVRGRRPRVLPARRVAAQGEHVLRAARCGLGQQRDEAVAREPGGGDVRDRFQPALAREPPHDGQRQVARRAARPAGDRDERGLERGQLLDRAPEGELGLDRARRRELEGDDRLAVPQALVEPHGVPPSRCMGRGRSSGRTALRPPGAWPRLTRPPRLAGSSLRRRRPPACRGRRESGCPRP